MSVTSMTTRAAIALLILGAWLSLAPGSQGRPARSPDWPEITHEAKPWTRWWWMGSAVDPAGLTADLESLGAAGIGGVEITPIYGAAGAESRFVPYLSDEWMRLLEHTLREAGRLGIGVDMATGTGWPFGGPWVGDRDSARTFGHRTWTLESGQRLTEPVRLEQAPMVRAVGTTIHEVIETPGDRAAQSARDQPISRPGARRIQMSDVREPVEANTNLQALALEQVRYQKPLPLAALVALRGQSGVKPGSDGGQITTVEDLTARVQADGTLDWTAPPGSWVLHGVFLGWHGKLVERAAPGGEGNVIDHFSRDAIRNYLGHFDRAFAGHRRNGLRAFFNDSYEVDDASGQADATALLFAEFQRRRGYDLRRHLGALFGSQTGDTSARVIADYRDTISDLLLDTFTTEWRTWAKGKSAIVRNQAHGSPANILDLYGASDIPETEGTEISRFKWATSAAHVAGHQLVSAEAATWLGEHFRVTLADVRAAVDRFFIAGVNHIVYHGTAYSPASPTPWPGWQFYASVEFNPRNSWWTDFSALNQYVTRVQSFMQSGQPDHDVLLYYPFYDSLADPGRELLKHYGGANQPAEGTTFESASDILQKRGYTYDFISDRQLANTRATGAVVTTGGGSSYHVLVVPASKFIPLDTFERILLLARGGATVVEFKGLPADVSGLADLDRRRARFERLRDQIQFGQADATDVREARLGRGTILIGENLELLLARARVQRETLVDFGIDFARRKYDGGRYYFIANTSDRDVDAWIPVNDRAGAVVEFDPMSGQKRVARVRRASGDRLEVELKLPRASSLVIATTDSPAGEPVGVFDTVGAPVEVPGPWIIRFAAGGPELPASRTIDRLVSWTTLGGEEVRRFSGTAVYSATFPRPDGANAFELDLGQVRESARIELNGRDLGTLIGPSFKVTLERSELAATNTLTIHVSNLMANRIAALDKAGVVWRNFYNVNFPARLPQNRGPDGLFSAAKWVPLESGLIGPVTLTPFSARK